MALRIVDAYADKTWRAIDNTELMIKLTTRLGYYVMPADRVVIKENYLVRNVSDYISKLPRTLAEAYDVDLLVEAIAEEVEAMVPASTMPTLFSVTYYTEVASLDDLTPIVKFRLRGLFDEV